MDNLKELIREFKAALDDEIRFIKKKGGSSKFLGRNGVLVEERGGRFIYVFVIDTPLPLPDDVPVNVRSQDSNVQGHIVNIEGLRITIALSQNLGPKISEVTITADPYYLLEILKKRFEEVEEGKINLNEDMIRKVFGLMDSKVGHDDDFQEREDYPIDDQKKRAIARSLGSEVTYVWGPPGTGKTRTLSALAEIFLKKGFSVLIVSHTNIAVDNAIQRIAPLLRKDNDEDYHSGKVIRYGNSQLKDLPDEVTLEYWVTRKSKKLTEEKKRWEEQRSRIESELAEKNKMLEIYAETHQVSKEILSIQERIEKRTDLLEEVSQSIQESKEQLGDVDNKIMRTEAASRFKKFLLGISPEELQKERERLLVSISQETENRRDCQRQLNNATGLLNEKKEESRNLCYTLNELTTYLPIIIECSNKACGQKLKINPKGSTRGLVTCTVCGNRFEYTFGKDDVASEDTLREEVDVAKDELTRVIKKISEMSDRLSQIEEHILKQASLLATTLTKVYVDPKIHKRRFDILIVDEASMAPLPMLFFGSGLGTQKAIIIGDFRQLAPIARANSELVNKWLKRDIFDQTGIIDALDRNEDNEKLMSLTEQHRMHKSIVQVVNNPIYDNRLRTAQKERKEAIKEQETISRRPFSGKTVVICDTSEFNPWCSTSSSGSLFNIYSAFLSLYLAEEALNSQISDIGIITPYAAQSRLLHKMVEDKGRVEIDPSSVHRFQGREKELIILDLAEGPPHQIRWLGNVNRTSDSARLINLAITRAKSKLIVIANLQYLNKKLTKNSILRRILDHLTENHTVVDTNTFFTFIPDHFSIEEMMNHERLLASDISIDDRTYFYTQAYFYPFFYRDLQECKKELVILSPFITRRRVDSLVNHFRQLLGKGKDILVVTKPIREQKFGGEVDEETTRYLKQIGVHVSFRRKMHEKLAIVDKSIIWQGSLNILSHRNTTELMTRIKTKEQRTAEELLKLLGIRTIKDIEKQEKTKSNIELLNKVGFGVCPNCGGKMILVKPPFGNLFLGCGNYRKTGCKETMQVDKEIIGKVYGKDYSTCERCGKPMEIRYSRKTRRRFLGCTGYPGCRFIRSF